MADRDALDVFLRRGWRQDDVHGHLEPAQPDATRARHVRGFARQHEAGLDRDLGATWRLSGEGVMAELRYRRPHEEKGGQPGPAWSKPRPPPRPTPPTLPPTLSPPPPPHRSAPPPPPPPPPP